MLGLKWSQLTGFDETGLKGLQVGLKVSRFERLQNMDYFIKNLRWTKKIEVL